MLERPVTKRALNRVNQQGRLFSTLSNPSHWHRAIENDPFINKSLVSNRFNLSDPKTLYFLGGFVEGEGSNSVSISIGTGFKYGVNIQPIFNVTQHENGLEILISYKELFGRGTIAKKSGSPHV